MTPLPKHWKDIQQKLLVAYHNDNLWEETDFAVQLPANLERGNDLHLAYLTLVYSISGGRDPEPLWEAARKTFEADQELFDLKFLAYAKPQTLVPRLQAHSLALKAKTESTIWQRTGQAFMMRASGSVSKLLADNDYDVDNLITLLENNKATFLALSGPQTAPRWVYGLSKAGAQPIKDVGELQVPVSPAIEQAFEGLAIEMEFVPAASFDALDALGRRGCNQRKPTETICPVAQECPVADFCIYGS